MTPLPKHLRPNWRYMAVGIESWPDASISRSTFQRHLWYAAQNLIGDAGSARVDLTVLGFVHADGFGEAVVRTHHDTVGEARAAVGALAEIGDHEIGIQVRGISGTVKSCEEKYLGREPEDSRERMVAFEDAERNAFQRDEATDIRIGSTFLGATTLDLE